MILCADLGATHDHDLAGLFASFRAVASIAAGPEPVLTEVLAHFDELLATSGD